MSIGDLVSKSEGYGKEESWLGIVLGFTKFQRDEHLKRVVVLHHGEIEEWLVKFTKVVQPVKD